MGGASLIETCAQEPERTLLRPGKALALLIYLAASPRRTASGEHLIDLFWADLHPDTARRALLALVRLTVREQPETGGKRALMAELVGREGEFARIIAAWENACRGSGRHFHITAAAGLGKTRLLSDVHARLRATGARTVYLRANPGERHIPYVFAADLAAGLATLPGAAALSPAAAAALGAVNPSLSSRYPTARDTAGGDEALRHRVLALAELLEDVSDEHPVALLIDDVHWIDPASRQLLPGLLDKVDRTRALVVTTARPTPGVSVETATAQHITLPPLAVSEVAPCSPAWAPCRRGTGRERSPNSSTARPAARRSWSWRPLQLALERESLLLGTEGWECPDPEKLATQLAAGSALRHRLEQLGARERPLLLALATAGTPLSVGLLAQAAQGSDQAAAADLDALEQRGLVMRDGDAWLPAHDEIAALALELASEDQLRAAHGALGRALARESSDDAGRLIRAGRHLAAADLEPELVVVYRRLVALARGLGDRRRPAELAGELLGEARSPARIRRLTASPSSAGSR